MTKPEKIGWTWIVVLLGLGGAFGYWVANRTPTNQQDGFVIEVETERLVCGVTKPGAISCVPKIPELWSER